MANLIYTDTEHNDIGYLTSFSLDCENGDENSFDIEMSIDNARKLLAGCYIYLEEDMEFGGRVTKRKVNTHSKTIIFQGLTWRGLLGTKVICPPPGESYRQYSEVSLSYIMNDVLHSTGLDDIFIAADNSGSIEFYQFNRYTDVMTGFTHLLNSRGLKLKCVYDPKSKKVVIYSRVAVDHSSDDYSSDHFAFVIEKDDFPINHVMGLGKGELVDRLIYSAYLQEDGTSGETPFYVGEKEHISIYDYTNYETEEEFKKAVHAKLLDLQKSTSLAISLTDMSVDIGDTVIGTEEVTGISVTKSIRSKILKMTDFDYSISYRTGD